MSRRPGWLVDQLPPAMVDEDFFRRFVTIFEEQADTLQAHGDNLDVLADTRLTPAEMLPWLASWIGVRALDGAAGVASSGVASGGHAGDPSSGNDATGLAGAGVDAAGVDAAGEARQRALLEAWAATLMTRGTPGALRTVLTALCGPGVVVREGGGVFAEGACPADTAWLEVELPSAGGLDARSLLGLVLDEIPAHVRATVRVAGDQIYPAVTADLLEGVR